MLQILLIILMQPPFIPFLAQTSAFARVVFPASKILSGAEDIAQ